MADGLRFIHGGLAEGLGDDASDAHTTKENIRLRAERLLIESRPLASCTLGLTLWQKTVINRIFALCGLALLILPADAFFVSSWIGFTGFSVLIFYRLMLVFAGAILCRDEGAARTGSDLEDLQIWPAYTVLVPVCREQDIVGALVRALEGIDYPVNQLDIQILLEEDDVLTRAALNAITLKSHFRVILVPAGDVQTKPRALNYGLALAIGRYVAIYDAEDKMHSGQLKAAVRAFQRNQNNGAVRPLACVQAPLVPHNGHESWIARQFELEYAAQFGLIVPGLATLECPVLLGGTSNHLERAVLEEVGGWDPYNVTEDADLGLRLARAGYRVGLISSPTFEEAPVRVRQWVHQRSRWIKGFIQTLGVFLREPCKGISEIGLIRWCSAVCLLGGAVLSSVVHGLLVIWLLMLALVPGWTLPGEAVVLLLSGFSVHILVSFLSMGQITFARLCGVMTAPLYWPLQTLAALKAIRELFTAPYFWDKTEHGVTRHQFDGSRLQG